MAAAANADARLQNAEEESGEFPAVKRACWAYSVQQSGFGIGFFGESVACVHGRRGIPG